MRDLNSGEIAVAVLNRTDEEKSVELDLSKLGIDFESGFDFKDLWSGEEHTGYKQKLIPTEVNAHGIVVYRINPM